MTASCICNREKKATTEVAVSSAIIEIQTSTPKYSAVVIPFFEKEMAFDASGELSFIADENMPLKKNDLLAELKAGKIVKSYDSLQLLQSAALKKLKRHEKLLIIEDIKQREYDKTEGEYKALTFRLDSIKTELDKYRIFAPMDGKVMKKMANKGQTISQGVSVLKFSGNGTNRVLFTIPSSLLKTIRNTDSLAFRPEKSSTDISLSSIEIFPSSRSTIDIVAYFDSTAYRNDSTLLATGVRGTITDYGSGTISNAIIPISALITDDQSKKTEVWLINNNNSISKITIITGSLTDSDHCTVLEGLEGGERVVTNPPSTLKEGMKVKIEK